MNLKQQKEDAEAQAVSWNSRFAVGQPVVVREDFKPKGTITKTTAPAREMCGSAVVWCEGISGAYDLTHVTPI